jgi:hypothetical protein
MKQLIVISILLTALVSRAQILPNYGGERAGISTLSFLKNDLSVTSTGMAGASLAIDGDAYSALSNPAALTHLKHSSYALSHLFIGAGINQSYFSGVYRLKDQVSNLGFNINSLNSGAMEERTEFQPEGTGRKVYVTNMAFGLTYSRRLSEVFSAGVTLKYIYENMAGFTNHSATVDLAFIYETDVKDLQFAVMVQNFGGNSSLNNDGNALPVVFNRDTEVSLDDNTVPTIFKLGASFKPLSTEKQSLVISLQLNHPNDNAENYSLGAMYQIQDLVFFRAGYKINVRDQNFPTFGFSYRVNIGAHPLYIDYGANPTNHLGLQNTFGLRIGINKDSR